jgi:vacuole morphology and inheritance protein 14
MSVTISNIADPLPPSVTKLLTDKLYEKRKTAALDVEKIIRDNLTTNNTTEISKIVKFLSNNYVLSQNQNNKKGGLIGLAASAIALGKEAHKHRSDLIPCVLACFSDPDSRVRYYACEALYNIVKVLKSSVLIYFNELFDGLCKLCCDIDSNVRNGAELLDRLLKDTVMENSSNVTSEKFDILVFIQLVRERIYSKNSYVRQFIVSWLKVLDSEPSINIIHYISELLDGLFQILDDPNQEIKKLCESLLGELLKEISTQPVEKLKFDEIINIILIHSANTNDDLIQFMALQWLKEMCMRQNVHTLQYMPGILFVTLPCLSYSDEHSKKNIRELAKLVNTKLWDVIETITDEVINDLSLIKVVESLMKHLAVPNDTLNVLTAIEGLKWLNHLIDKQPEATLKHIEVFFPVLIQFLSSLSKDMLELDLKLLANISSSVYLTDDVDKLATSNNKYNKYFYKFMQQLVDLFHRDTQIRYEKGSIIIKQLCILLQPDDIYIIFAEILLNEADLEFTQEMVNILNTILLTSNELFELRNYLKEFNCEKSFKIFTSLYKTWSYNPIATVSLCLLSQNYEHAYNLINLFANIEITIQLLTTIDKLVQLIESPIFTYLRLDLLDYHKNHFLVRALYGLLMLLPQSEAFLTLKRRLDCVPSFYNKIDLNRIFHASNAILNESEKKNDNVNESCDFKVLLEHFFKIQEKQKGFKKSRYL